MSEPKPQYIEGVCLAYQRALVSVTSMRPDAKGFDLMYRAFGVSRAQWVLELREHGPIICCGGLWMMIDDRIAWTEMPDAAGMVKLRADEAVQQ